MISESDDLSLHQELIDLRASNTDTFHKVFCAIISTARTLSLEKNRKGRIDMNSPCKENGMFIIIPDPDTDIFTNVTETLAIYSLPTNKIIGDKLKAVALLRQRQGDKRSCTTHKKAAHLISTHDSLITSGNQAKKIKGIGDSIAKKIDEILRTGTLEILEVKSETDIALELFQNVWGANIVTSRHWFDLKYRTISDLKTAASNNSITLTKQQTLGLKHYEDFNNIALNREDMDDITEIIKGIVNYVGACNFRTITVGSYRRGRRSSKDVDILIIGDTKKIPNMADRILHELLTKSNLDFEAPCHGQHQILGSLKIADKQRGFCYKRVDIFIADEGEEACSLLAHTGPAQYNIKLRKKAMEMGLILNEKCLADVHGTSIPTHTEADVQSLLGFPVKEPKDRF